MSDKINQDYSPPGTAAFNNFNNVTGSADSASGGSGGSGMECLQLRSTPGPFHYLISEQAKSLVALQELQNEVGALLEFRDLVIETFPNLRSKMSPSSGVGARRDWEPGVRVRRKLPAHSDNVRTKPQPSVQDSGFSTETSCGKDGAHSSSASATRSRPVEDELWALLDVIQRKGVRLREEAELLRNEISSETTEDSFARAISASQCTCEESRRLREERDELLAKAAELEASVLFGAAASSPKTPVHKTPSRLGKLDSVLETPIKSTVPTPDSKKIAAILQESNSVELQRQLLVFTVQNQALIERLKSEADKRTALLDKLDRAREENDDLKFQLEEKTIELEGARALTRQLETREKQRTDAETNDRERDHSSMRDMEPVSIPSGTAGVTPPGRRGRPSRIPLSSRGAPRPPSAGSTAGSGRSRPTSYVSLRRDGRDGRDGTKKVESRRPAPPAPDKKKRQVHANVIPNVNSNEPVNFVTRQDTDASELIAEYLWRTDKLVHNQIFSRMNRCVTKPVNTDCRVAYEPPQNLALELSKSILYEVANSIDLKTLKSINSHTDSKQYNEDSLWNGKPQQYFESMKFSENIEGLVDKLNIDDVVDS